MHNIGRKKLFLVLLTAVFLWENGGQEFLWQKFFSSAIVEKSDKEPVLRESLTPLEEMKIEKMRFGNEDVYIKKVGKYQGLARVMYVDVYDRSFYIGFRPLSAKFEKFYNNVAPLDISLFTGNMGKDGNWQKFDVDHEYRSLATGIPKEEDIPLYNKEETSNNHIIPANNNIRRVFDIMKKGKTVYIEGYLVDWWGKVEGVYDIIHETAREIGEYYGKEYLAGGRLTGRCRQIYVTKVIYNGYVYE